MAKSLIVSNPSIDGPAFRFGSGVDGTESYYSSLPNVGAPQSAWHIAQWHTTQTLDPSKMIVNDDTSRDTIFGNPDFSWKTDNGNLGFSVYGYIDNYGYRLSSYNGTMFNDGSQNLFLETTVSGMNSTFDHPITFDADEGLTNTIPNGLAQQVLNGFTVTFNAVGSAHYNSSLRSQSVFLQAEIADSRGFIPAYQSLSQDVSIFNIFGQDSLQFNSSKQLSHVSIDLNAALLSFINNYGVAFGENEQAGFKDASNWSIRSVYLGLETTDGGGASLDVQNVKLQTDADATYLPNHGKTVSIVSVPSLAQLPVSQATTVPTSPTPASSSSVATLSVAKTGAVITAFSDCTLVECSGFIKVFHNTSQIQFQDGLVDAKQSTNPISKASNGTCSTKDIFDADYYKAQNPDVAKSGIDPYTHYMAVGWKEGRNPNPLFDTNFYLNHYADVKNSGLNPLAHYAISGAGENRQPSALFDQNFYLQTNVDVARSGLNPLLHFETVGWREGRDPNPLFNVRYYISTNSDVAAVGADPVVHFKDYGWREGRDPSQFFSGSSYLAHNADLVSAGVNPLEHYLSTGVFEGRSI